MHFTYEIDLGDVFFCIIKPNKCCVDAIRLIEPKNDIIATLIRAII